MITVEYYIADEPKQTKCFETKEEANSFMQYLNELPNCDCYRALK